MNDSPLHPLARDYLKRLQKAAAYLPSARRAELIEEIEEHLRESLPPGIGEAEAREALERLGSPEEIVAEAAPGLPPPAAGLHEWLAIPLLLVGGFLFVVGWFVGLVLLWSSKIWTLRDKVIGTVLIPGGWATSAFLLAGVAATTGEGCSDPTVTAIRPVEERAVNVGSSCASSGDGINYLALALLILLTLLPALTSIYLGRRAVRADACA